VLAGPNGPHKHLFFFSLLLLFVCDEKRLLGERRNDSLFLGRLSVEPFIQRSNFSLFINFCDRSKPSTEWNDSEEFWLNASPISPPPPPSTPDGRLVPGQWHRFICPLRYKQKQKKGKKGKKGKNECG
jgi:hypothetical protein